MPIAGERPIRMGTGYINDPLYEYAKTFRDVTTGIVQENGVDLFMEPSKALILEGSNDTLLNFFTENSCDREGMSVNEYDDHMKMMKELYINDREAILEYSPVNAFNPIMGMTFPIHKNILMNTVFDKGAIQKAVAVSPKFTVSMEQRILVDPEGNEIDIFKQQDMIKEAMDKAAPFKEVVIDLPEVGVTDVLDAIGANSKDNLSIETHVSAVKVKITKSDNDLKEVWVPVRMYFSPSYGEYDRTLMDSVVVEHDEHVDDNGDPREPIKDTVTASMSKNVFQITSFHGKILAVKLKARLDTSSGLVNTCSTQWKVRTDIVEIPSAIPINTPVSPEEIKDVAALYQADQLAKIMAMIKDILGNYKDDTIREKLDDSFEQLDPSQKGEYIFDMVPRDGYALDHVEWRRKTFFDALDTYATEMLEILNDTNMVITVVGRSDLIRKIKPTEYTYQSPAEIGPVMLEYDRTVVTSDNRTYQFISSQKMKGSDELIVLLKPHNSERIIYRIYDYQMYVSNEIRNASNHALPAVHAFDRWKFLEYQPVQSRILILNPTGLKED